MKPFASLLGLWLVAAQPALAQSIDISGQIDFGFRHFTKDGLFAGQSDAGTHFFVGGKINATIPLGAGEVALQFSALSDDRSGRSFTNLTRAYYTQAFDSFDVLIGYNVENWGVAESQSVLNVINPEIASDLAFGREQRGTPMINVNFDTGIGTLSAYALLGFEQPILPNAASRTRALWASDPSRAVFQDRADQLDIALRFTSNFELGSGAVDIALSYFNGTDRTPLSLPGCIATSAAINDAACDAINTAINTAIVGAFESGANGDAIRDFLLANATDDIVAAASALPSAGFIPYYQQIQHVGGSLVYARGDLQLRFEGAYRKPKNENGSFAGVIGGDYTFYDVLGEGTLTVAAEYLYHDANARQPLSIFDNDVFLGMNFSLNDTRDTRLTAGGFYDLDSHAQLYQLSLSTRINDSVRAEFNAVHAETNGWNDPLSFIARDTFFEMKFSAFF